MCAKEEDQEGSHGNPAPRSGTHLNLAAALRMDLQGQNGPDNVKMVASSVHLPAGRRSYRVGRIF